MSDGRNSVLTSHSVWQTFVFVKNYNLMTNILDIGTAIFLLVANGEALARKFVDVVASASSFTARRAGCRGRRPSPIITAFNVLDPANGVTQAAFVPRFLTNVVQLVS